MRKRNIILGIAAIELAALPLAMLIGAKSYAVERVNVITAEIESPPGIKQYFVSSDGAFDVVASNLQGQILISANAEGQIGQAHYGGNSQLPGPAQDCALVDSANTQVIYRAHQGTIRANGNVVSQAVLLRILHDDSVMPDIQFVHVGKSKDLPKAKACRLAEKTIAPH